MNTAEIVRKTWCVIVILLTTSQISAADRLRLKLSTVTSAIRSDAPLLLNVHLDWASTELLEGRLELTCYDGKQLLHRNVGYDVALFTGDRHSRTVLPPMSLSAELSTLTVNARFLSETSSYDLGSFDLRVPVHWRRSFVIGVMVPNEHVRVAGSTALGQSLRLEQLSLREVRSREIVSTSSQFTPEDLRASGLDFFPFDVLALTRQAFSVLTPSQLDTIGGWVEAGGSLIVVADSRTLVEQAGFLNRVAGLPADDPGLLPGTVGFPAGGIRDRNGILRMYRPGLGRAVILPAEAQTDAETDLSEAAAFLWKVRSEMQSEFRDTGTSRELSKRLSGPEVDQFGNWRTGQLGDSDFLYSPFQPVRLPEADGLTTILLPDDVRSLPLHVVVLILALFLAAIVPVDYFVLGHFNCRRLTWILLPVVSLLFTGLTVRLGNAYLGSTDYRTSLEFVDLTTGDRVVRSSRFEMLFTATQRDVATEVKQAIHAGVSLKRRSEAGEWNAGRSMMTSDLNEESVDGYNQSQNPESSLYEGNMPTLFTVRQQMRKWTPQFSRQTSLQTERPIPQFDLDDVGTAWQQNPELIGNNEWQKSLRERMRTALPDSKVLLFTQNQILDLTQGEGLQGPDTPAGPSDTKDGRLLELVRKVSVRPAVGMFSVVSQISPNGAGNFEDLSIVDPGDASQLLLVIVTRQENDYVVFRRQFHRGS